MQWLLYAVFSAIFAALTTILAKIGIKHVDSNLATAIRTTIVLILAWTIVIFQGNQNKVSSISQTSLIFLVLSGIATGLSWLFYFKALQIGPASKVVAIDKLSLVLTILFASLFLSEQLTLKVIIGALIMSFGAILISLN